jgi:hypothetical protein
MSRWLFSIVAKNVRAWRLFWTNQRNNRGPELGGYSITSSARAISVAGSDSYFSELLMEVNFVFSLAPMPFTMLMMASEMPAAIKPYSIAVAPFSSRKNSRSNRIEIPLASVQASSGSKRGILSRPAVFRGDELIDT